MSRVRLTSNSRSAADQTPYPGNVNQDRKDPSHDQYHTFEQKVNHELPDMRHQWQDDSRDDIGFGVPEAWGKSPTVASVRVAANKAVRVAMLLLGEKVADDVVEAQAHDFMAMGPQAMDRTLQRFADTQALYAADDEKVEDKADEKVEDKADEKKAADEKVEDKADEKVEDKADEKKAADVPDFIKEKKDEKKDDEKKDEKKASDTKDDDEKVDEKVDEKTASATRTGMNEFDIELTSMEDEVAPDPEADERLASVLWSEGTTAGTSDRKVEASQKKTGITKLGG